jgi:hypothetical protein
MLLLLLETIIRLDNMAIASTHVGFMIYILILTS